MRGLIANRRSGQDSRGMRRPAPVRQRGVLLVNTGTPENPDLPSVRRYLTEFLSDPLVIRLPAGLGWLQGTIGRLIARFRAPRSVEKYRRIWTDRGSPLRAIMDDQASALAAALPDGWQVFVGMRYGQPRIADVLREIEEAGIEELVVVPMYPQFSGPTTGTVVRELYRALRHVGHHINVATRPTWYDDIGYINAQARLIAETASSHDLKPEDTHLLFSAHSLPVSYVQRGDPYARHVDRTVKLVAQRLGWPADRMSLAYQSRLGPAEWLKPDLEEQLATLSRAGEKKVLVCPVSFCVDCLETVEGIGVHARERFEAGGGRLHLCPALNTSEAFIAALKNLVLRGPQPMTSWGEKPMPLLAPKPDAEPADNDLDSLVVIGVSLRNRVGAGRGPRLLYSGLSDFCRIKKPHDEVGTFLQKVRDEGSIREALVWNTCHRFEFYGWLEGASAAADRECAVARLRHQVLGNEPEGLGVNVLFGTEARHHLMRTVAGLNSGLPGDRDVVEQFQMAHRVAEQAGTAGPRAKRLVNEAVALAGAVRAETGWGRFDPSYCHASLSRVEESAGLDWAACRHVIVGGSTTSCSVLRSLSERFTVHERQMTLAYRGHRGGQMKLLRRAIGNGRRVRAQSYSERAVIDAIADADVVVFGIDREEPVLRAEDLRGVRDFAKRPLTVIDFNTFGSTGDLGALEGVTVWNAEQLEKEVDRYANAMCAEDRFIKALEEAETWIEKHVTGSTPPRIASSCVRGGPYAGAARAARAAADAMTVKGDLR